MQDNQKVSVPATLTLLTHGAVALAGTLRRLTR